MSELPPVDHTHKNNTPVNDPSDWDAMCAPEIHTFTCRVCGKGWSPRGRDPGWNRCPHCKTPYSAVELLGQMGVLGQIPKPTWPDGIRHTKSGGKP